MKSWLKTKQTKIDYKQNKINEIEIKTKKEDKTNEWLRNFRKIKIKKT